MRSKSVNIRKENKTKDVTFATNFTLSELDGRKMMKKKENEVDHNIMLSEHI